MYSEKRRDVGISKRCRTTHPSKNARRHQGASCRETKRNRWAVRHVHGKVTTTAQLSLQAPPKQALQRRLELAPVRIIRLFQAHAVIPTPLLLKLLLLLGLAAFALAIFALLLLVDDEHARRAGLEARALGDAGVPEARCGHRFVRRLSFARAFGIWLGWR